MSQLEALKWIAKQLDSTDLSDAPSLWHEIKNISYHSKTVNKIIQINITGETDVIFKYTDLFLISPSENEITVLNSKNSLHPALQWMVIHYYPPKLVNNLGGDEYFTLFVDNRLPLWSKKLIIANKVSRVLSVRDLVDSNRFTNVRFNRLEDMNYFDLMDDSLVKKMTYTVEQLHSELPKQLIVSLLEVHNEKECNEILDLIAMFALNDYWLKNKPEIKRWFPVLMREIQQYLDIQSSECNIDQKVEMMKEWVSNDKSIK